MNHQAIADQAADWIVREEADDWDVASQAALQDWLGASDAHKAAYWRLRHTWREADRLQALRTGRSPPRETSAVRPRWLGLAAAAALIAALAVGWTSTGFRLGEPQQAMVTPATFETAIGGRQAVRLADGSAVELNTGTVLKTGLSRSAREVWLERGEAFFEVAHDPARPFVVRVADREVKVLGTRFAVRREGAQVKVMVLEGHVTVAKPSTSESAATSLVAGDIAVSQGDLIVVTDRSIDGVERALAWRSGRLSFEDAPLSRVVNEFNRYNATRLVLTDAKAARLRIGGQFPVSDPLAFARLQRDGFGLTVVIRQNEILISDPSGGSQGD